MPENEAWREIGLKYKIGFAGKDVIFLKPLPQRIPIDDALAIARFLNEVLEHNPHEWVGATYEIRPPDQVRLLEAVCLVCGLRRPCPPPAEEMP